MKKNRALKAFSSFLIAAVMILSLGISAFAETAGEKEDNDISVVVTNILKTKVNINAPNAIFQYSYTKDGIVNFQGPGSAAYNKPTIEDATQPDLDNTQSQLQAKYENTMNPYPNLVDSKRIYKIVGGNILPEASKFKHAGVYSYTIKQVLADGGNSAEYITCSKAEYKLYVYVENEDNGLVISGASAYKVVGDDGKTVQSSAKIDLNNNTYAPGDGSDFVFINEYNPDKVGFSIVNSIIGEYADMTKSFDLELTLNNPDGETGEYTYKAVMIDEETNLPISDSLLSFTTGKVTTIQIKDKERLTFVKDDYVINKEKELTDEETECLPAGATFLLTNKGTPAYYCKYTPVFGGIEGNTVVGNTGQDMVINGKTIGKYLNPGLNQINLLQIYKDVTVTGVVAKIMPAFILVLFAVIGIAFGHCSRRINEEE